uniref:Uncharacterized protein n=1 Tax=Pyxicephalus adspersus TaxID=30357 RepID=A0AAV3ALJ5_PYXAD|nr:TPA: hypothetical protein GDO54_010237 [Pyxicephalus adspersus]
MIATYHNESHASSYPEVLGILFLLPATKQCIDRTKERSVHAAGRRRLNKHFSLNCFFAVLYCIVLKLILSGTKNELAPCNLTQEIHCCLFLLVWVFQHFLLLHK